MVPHDGPGGKEKERIKASYNLWESVAISLYDDHPPHGVAVGEDGLPLVLRLDPGHVVEHVVDEDADVGDHAPAYMEQAAFVKYNGHT